MRKRKIHHSKHPFNAHPFEALCCGAWQPVELLEIRNGSMTVNFVDTNHGVAEKGPYANLRIKSRQASLSDCTCFLRPGVDVCVLSSSQESESLQEEEEEEEEIPEPVWVDARISSIERKPHAAECTCQFFVKLYVDQGPLGSEKATLSKETEEVGIHQISILQKLGKEPCQSQFYRWDFSEDCPLIPRTKLFLGKFSSDLTWLIALSFQMKFAFDVKSVQNKIIYQILEGDYPCSLGYNGLLKCVNFKLEDGNPAPIMVELKPSDPCVTGAEPLTSYDVLNLRRSKRRNVQPDRFLACEITPDMETSWVRCMPYTPVKWKEEEMFLPFSYLMGEHADASCSEERTEAETRVSSKKVDSVEDGPVSKSKRKSDLSVYSKRKSQFNSDSAANKNEDHLAIVPVTAGNGLQILDQLNSTSMNPEMNSKEKMKMSHAYKTKGSFAAHMSTLDLDDLFTGSKWAGKIPFKKGRSRVRNFRDSKREGSCASTSFKKNLSSSAYSKLINSYMKNIDFASMSKEEPQIIDQWKEFKARNLPDLKVKLEENEEDERELSETEMLWQEMELFMAAAYLQEENEAQVPKEAAPKSNENCQHQFKLNEEIGILCHICGVVTTEIKHVAPAFGPFGGLSAGQRSCNEEDPEVKADDEPLDLLVKGTPMEDVRISEVNDNVWDLIPELRMKLHPHQKKAFEFLWRNIAGSTIPELMEKASKKTGGCVISHTPGAGKTFLIIAFLVSYLRLFPGKRPLVLAPKTTLYTWHKEFIKWDIPIPVHLIHGRKSYRIFRQQSRAPRGALQPSLDVMHVLDCLEKMNKWHAQPSILVMGYSSFLTLMREDGKFSYRQHMARVLRESPGLLVLDEGHNPRSTKSRLRKVLMKVETDHRILLSGTLFQNNFCEYFNTLCLARPQFIREVLKVLDPKFTVNSKLAKKARHLLEYRARKYFIDTISRKIDSSDADERMEGLNMLRNLTSGFIDVYEPGNADSLPGLQIYTIMMNSTPKQEEILAKLQKIMITYPGYPLELELLITLASIHPWLIKTSVCCNKFFTPEELMELEKMKSDIKRGSKVMFVLNLVSRVISKEKVLLFCHNIAPINLFVELFERVFKWKRGKEILVLTGDLELFQRGQVMDKFEEAGGQSRVLLASITACAEGISLTAASRVILLDSEWNPSKTKQAIARAYRPGQQKLVYVYQLLATDTLEQDKHRRTTWKQWLSSMIFSEEFVEDPSKWQAEKIEDEVLRELVEEDKVKSFHMIMKNEKASTS